MVPVVGGTFAAMMEAFCPGPPWGMSSAKTAAAFAGDRYGACGYALDATCAPTINGYATYVFRPP
ncbi:hypothetical protein EG244_07190 [Falsigemmobacter faecalis]|uniref:Uncharacterized protein n=2 Tax=Falsigemmobacter faecalis TaxID=2488730 RepID=A0A3P3DQH7_9RHOB|nr:hypothetical protein EG244_07190 [Falsigemmobacter faecalis]